MNIILIKWLYISERVHVSQKSHSCICYTVTEILFSLITLVKTSGVPIVTSLMNNGKTLVKIKGCLQLL